MLGSVQGDLHAGVAALQWVVSAYALTFAVAMLAFGMVGDEFGRKRALGPVIGGALTGIWDWRAMFWFNLLFGAVALGLGTLVLPESADPDAHRVDIAGTVLGAVALSVLVFAVISAETAGFAAPDVIALLCISTVADCASSGSPPTSSPS